MMEMREKAEMAASVSRYSVNTWLTALRMVRDWIGSDGRCLLQAAEVPEVQDTLIAVGQDDPIKAADAILRALDAYRSQRLDRAPFPGVAPRAGRAPEGPSDLRCLRGVGPYSGASH